MAQHDESMPHSSRQPRTGLYPYDHRVQSYAPPPRVPVKLLPTQVLCKIFATCARISAYDRNWTWITVTHVCSAWRRAALAHPPLWGNIDFTHSKLTTLTLKRAKSVPLVIRTTVENHNIKQLHQILHTSPLVHEIDIVSSLHGFQSLTEALTKPHPQLKSLSIVILGHRDNREVAHYKIPSSVTDGTPLPALTTLELHRSPFALVSPRFVSLTHLSLHSLPPSERPELRDFLVALVRFPFLQSLTLVDAFPLPITPGSPSDNGRCIRLPRLLSITLQGGIVEVSQLLDHLILPPMARIKCSVDYLNASHVNQYGDPEPLYDIRRLAKALGEHLSSGARSFPLHKVVLTSREESFRFTSSANHDLNPGFRQSFRIRGFRADSGWENAALDLSLNITSRPCEDEVIIAWLTMLWRVVPLANVHTLALQHLDIITQKSWQKLLEGLPSVQVIEINGYPPSGLIWALLLNAKAHGEIDADDSEEYSDGSSSGRSERGPGSAIFLPCLKDIYLYDVDCFQGGFMVCSTSPINSHRDVDDSRFLDVLLYYLQQRLEYAQREAPRLSGPHKAIRSLRLFQCKNVLDSVMGELRKCIRDVYWDRRGGMDEDQALELRGVATYRRRVLVPGSAGSGSTTRHFQRLATIQGA
ncbi:hypothetical protein BDN72DRAFT_892169 [Pluteus cervinus]|uniref:Uncharacterized protein n=1 Tax=Pluteus cervinus TaxID=181527 RepID=A0ACD3BDI3_9AGAR|nr:hypothetical protein BDN72DRAFT_892169 [Pluteus cervinus]